MAGKYEPKPLYWPEQREELLSVLDSLELTPREAFYEGLISKEELAAAFDAQKRRAYDAHILGTMGSDDQ